MKPPEGRWSIGALSVPAAVYGSLMRARNRYYDRPGNTTRVGVPVISVGNLTVGGTGKTPLVSWLARHLARLGQRPAVVSRGYGGRAGRGPLIVSRGEGPLCDWPRAGDEPHLLASTLPGVLVVVGSDRVAGANAAREAGADVLLLDDGFQHRRLARDLDLVLLDTSNPFGSRRTLPAGILREPLDGLSRASIVLLTRSAPNRRLPELESEIRQYNPRAPMLYAGHRATGFVSASGEEVAPPARAVAFCGIGNPERFRADLTSLGVEVVAFSAHPDHHPYRPEDLAPLVAEAERSGAGLVTTEKDLTRLRSAPPATKEVPLLALRIEAEVYEPDPLLERVDRTLDEGGR